MSITSTIIHYLTVDLHSTFLTLFIGFVFYYLSKFYVKVWSLPPGPIPLPFVGNFLLLRGTKRQAGIEILEFSKKYGPIFTFWMGNSPVVIITDRDIARETFRKNEFTGRPESFFAHLWNRDPYIDVAFSDYGQQWEALRRVAHSAVRKYYKTEKLAVLVSDVVDNTVKSILEKEGINKPFDATNYVYNIFLNIMASSTLGKRYDLDDPEFKQIKYLLVDLFFNEFGGRLALWEYLPIFRLIDRKKLIKIKFHLEIVRTILNENFKIHSKEFNPTDIRDFCDAVISAKNEAIAEGKDSAPYLADNKLIGTLWDMFTAGTDTSNYTFQWFLKIMAFYPEIQTKLREEIKIEIQDRMATQADTKRCHYTNAFISECMRFRVLFPMGVFHKTVVQSKIGDFTIPEGISVMIHQYSIHNDEKYWDKPNEFIPERFLENGKYVSPLPSAFIPFSVGRRVCLGEKLALADVFLVLVRFLQKTNGYVIALEKTDDNNNLDHDETQPDSLIPKKIQLILKK